MSDSCFSESRIKKALPIIYIGVGVLGELPESCAISHRESHVKQGEIGNYDFFYRSRCEG